MKQPFKIEMNIDFNDFDTVEEVFNKIKSNMKKGIFAGSVKTKHTTYVYRITLVNKPKPYKTEIVNGQTVETFKSKIK